jgi:hypothetical protein
MGQDLRIAMIVGLTATILPSVGILMVWLQNKTQFAAIKDSMKQGFDAVDRRFDDMRDLWRGELRGFEERLGAKLN